MMANTPLTASEAVPRSLNLERLGILYARIALGAAFLSGIADRFGLYTGRNVGYGDFDGFLRYTAKVNSFMPASTIPFLAWAATVAELSLGIALILGLWPRWVALSSALLLVLFGTAMAISFGIKSPLDYSVFSASAGAVLLALYEKWRIWREIVKKMSPAMRVAASVISALTMPMVPCLASSQNEKPEILQVREAVWRAWFANDTAALERLVPPDTLVISAGENKWKTQTDVFQTAAQFSSAGAKLIRLEFPRTEIQRYGDVAVVHSQYLVETELNGKRSLESGRVTEIFVRRHGKWTNPSWHTDAFSPNL